MADIDVGVKCGVCNAALDHVIKYDVRGVTFIVEPCEVCLDKAHEIGREIVGSP